MLVEKLKGLQGDIKAWFGKRAVEPYHITRERELKEQVEALDGVMMENEGLLGKIEIAGVDFIGSVLHERKIRPPESYPDLVNKYEKRGRFEPYMILPALELQALNKLLPVVLVSASSPASVVEKTRQVVIGVEGVERMSDLFSRVFANQGAVEVDGETRIEALMIGGLDGVIRIEANKTEILVAEETNFNDDELEGIANGLKALFGKYDLKKEIAWTALHPSKEQAGNLGYVTAYNYVYFSERGGIASGLREMKAVATYKYLEAMLGILKSGANKIVIRIDREPALIKIEKFLKSQLKGLGLEISCESDEGDTRGGGRLVMLSPGLNKLEVFNSAKKDLDLEEATSLFIGNSTNDKQALIEADVAVVVRIRGKETVEKITDELLEEINEEREALRKEDGLIVIEPELIGRFLSNLVEIKANSLSD